MFIHKRINGKKNKRLINEAPIRRQEPKIERTVKFSQRSDKKKDPVQNANIDKGNVSQQFAREDLVYSICYPLFQMEMGCPCFTGSPLCSTYLFDMPLCRCGAKLLMSQDNVWIIF